MDNHRLTSTSIRRELLLQSPFFGNPKDYLIWGR